MFERPFGNCVCNIFLSFSRNRLAQWFKQCHAIQLFSRKKYEWMNESSTDTEKDSVYGRSNAT